MTLTTALYLTDVIAAISLIFTSITIFCSVLWVAAMVIVACGSNDACANQEKAQKTFGSLLKKWPFIVIMILVCCLLPAKKTMYLMLGASYLQDSSLPTKVSRALELKLDDYIKELSAKK